MSDPVSWLLIERGWKVVSSEGEQLGRVEKVTGDPSADIFSGLEVAIGLLKAARFIPAEHIAEILEDEIRLDLTSEQARTVEFHMPGARSIRP
jgi:uncharacterized protein YrrD